MIGLLGFTLIDLQGLEGMGSWLVCLALLFAVASLVYQIYETCFYWHETISRSDEPRGLIHCT